MPVAVTAESPPSNSADRKSVDVISPSRRGHADGSQRLGTPKNRSASQLDPGAIMTRVLGHALAASLLSASPKSPAAAYDMKKLAPGYETPGSFTVGGDSPHELPVQEAPRRAAAESNLPAAIGSAKEGEKEVMTAAANTGVSVGAETAEGGATRNSRSSDLDEVCRAIRDAEFVALDLEFSGLFTHYRKHNDIQGHYDHCVENVRNFLTIQMGVCTATRSAQSNVWVFTPFNFHVYPSQRHVFHSDSFSLKWLLQQGFDFAKWIAEGCDYARLGALQALEEERTPPHRPFPKDIGKCGLQRIVECIVMEEKPLVVHNGFLDLLHIYDKFIGELPASVGEFCAEWIRLFPGGVYDTKRLAQHGKYYVLHLADSKGMGLEELRGTLLARSDLKTQFTIAEHRRPYIPEYTLAPVPQDRIHKKAHEAGFDALATAQIFLLELELFTREEAKGPTESSNAGSPRKKQRLLTAAESPGSSGSCPEGQSILHPWKHLSVCQKLKNVLELANVRPGELDFAKLQTPTPAPAPAPAPLAAAPSHMWNQAAPTASRSSAGAGHVSSASVRKMPPTCSNAAQSAGKTAASSGGVIDAAQAYGPDLHPTLQKLFKHHQQLQRQRWTNNQQTPANLQDRQFCRITSGSGSGAGDGGGTSLFHHTVVCNNSRNLSRLQADENARARADSGNSDLSGTMITASDTPQDAAAAAPSLSTSQAVIFEGEAATAASKLHQTATAVPKKRKKKRGKCRPSAASSAAATLIGAGVSPPATSVTGQRTRMKSECLDDPADIQPPPRRPRAESTTRVTSIATRGQGSGSSPVLALLTRSSPSPLAKEEARS